MASSITQKSKNNVTVTKASRGEDLTWNEATFTWDDAGNSTWASQGRPVTKTNKNNVNVTLTSKN